MLFNNSSLFKCIGYLELTGNQMLYKTTRRDADKIVLQISVLFFCPVTCISATSYKLYMYSSYDIL